MIAARQEARRNFDQNRRVAIDTGMQINHAIEVANILRHNLVQGAREDGDESAKWRTWNHVSPWGRVHCWQLSCAGWTSIVEPMANSDRI
jgi:hypothetical protein